jgi:hypothetical protein
MLEMPRRMDDEELLERLKANPEIRERLEGTLLAVADEQGELGDADAAEMRLIDEMRQMGRASLSAWAERKAARETEGWQARPEVWREGKKNSAGTPPSET